MKKILQALHIIILSSALLIFAFVPQAMGQGEKTDQLHTPPVGSPERKAIMDILREEYKSGSGIQVVFKVNYLKVHHGWAWTNVTPLGEGSKPVGEDLPALLHLENGKWVNLDLVAIAEALDDPVGPNEPNAKYLQAVQKKFPGVPADIFPKPRK